MVLLMCFKLFSSIHALLSSSLKIQRASKKIGFEMSSPLYRRGGLSKVENFLFHFFIHVLLQ